MTRNYDIVVIGAGAAGLVIAIGAAKAGKKILLIEKGEYGGDCTNYGCIPSKSLIASAKAIHTLQTTHEMGVEAEVLAFDAQKALERVRLIVQEIRSHEDPSALKVLGIETLNGLASFKDPHTLIIHGKKPIRAKKFVIATGSSPMIPSIDGLKETPFLTNETIFDLSKIPKSIVFIGGGPINAELAQAFSRLGSKITLIGSKPYLLPREDKETQHLLYEIFQKEGLALELGTKPCKVSYDSRTFSIVLENGKTLRSEALFIGAGRCPNLRALELDHAGIRWSENGIIVDKYGRTSKPHIWAVGDAIGPPFFTHFAENQARTILKSLLLPFKVKQSSQALPRCTYTDPEVASIGLLPEETLKMYGQRKIAIYTIPFSEVDRNITSGKTEGFVKIVTKKWSSKILGATIVGSCAGEMLMEISTAMYTNTPLRKLSSLIHPYPIQSMAIRKAADLWLTQTILGLLRRKG